MSADHPLDGVAALVTDAGSGIGAATVRALAARGAAVALVARQRGRLDDLAAEIAALGGNAYVLDVDATDRAEEAVGDAVERLGRLDLLINNAGVRLLGTALHAPIRDWDTMVRFNLITMLRVTHAALPYLIDAAATSPRRVADIVNISSTAGRAARPGASVYSLTGFGLAGFSESLRQELLGEGVRVSLIEPDAVSAGVVDHLSYRTRDAAELQMGSIEPLRSDDIAEAIAFVVTRDRRVAVNEILVRAGNQTR